MKRLWNFLTKTHYLAVKQAQVRQIWVLMGTFLGLILGLTLEEYLLRKHPKYAFIVPLVFLFLPASRIPMHILSNDPWFYSLIDIGYWSFSFFIVFFYYWVRKFFIEKKNTQKQREIDRSKIQDL